MFRETKSFETTHNLCLFLSSHKVEQQGYKSCIALLKLADRYSVQQLESACRKALSYTVSPSVQTILKSGQDKLLTEDALAPSRKNQKPCALGMAASRSFYSMRHIHLPDLLVEISLARTDGIYRDYKKLKKDKLLILDEWLLYPLKEAEARDVLELVDARTKVPSTIFCSQYDISEWHENGSIPNSV